MMAASMGLVGLGAAAWLLGASPAIAQQGPPPRPAEAGSTPSGGNAGQMQTNQVQHSPSPAIAPASAQPQGALTPAEVRELLDAAGATAKATREAVDYGRVVPDLLTQILTKLDKLENKLDKIENAVKAEAAGSRRR